MQARCSVFVLYPDSHSRPALSLDACFLADNCLITARRGRGESAAAISVSQLGRYITIEEIG